MATEKQTVRALPSHMLEFNVRSVGVGLIVAAIIGCAYPYIVLKIGFGPTISVVAAFFAYLLLNFVALFGSRFKSNRFEYNIVQTAGTAAAQTAFMCVVLAAFDMLAAKPELGFHLTLEPWVVFVWMSLAGCLGVLLAVPMRKHYIDEEKLTFADGTAAGESLLILDANTQAAKDRVKALGVGGAIGLVTTWLREGWPKWIPPSTYLGPTGEKLHVGMSWSALSFGSGLIVGFRITMSMGLGMLLAWFIAPPLLVDNGLVKETAYMPVLRWVMWPATGLLVAGGLTALVLKWRLIQKTFGDLASGTLADGSDFPMKWVGVGSGLLSVVLIAFQSTVMGVAVWESAVAILISVVLMLVGIRVLGETNWAPISAMANMVQAVFALISPGSIGTNMVASGMSGTIAGSGEHLMQDYKAGYIIGSNNRALTYMQLLATPVGAACIALVYPLLKRQYGIGGDCYGRAAELAGDKCSGLTSPVSVKWAGFAELLMGGIDKLPQYAGYALAVGVAAGIAITIFESRFKQYLPSPTGMALGMLIPAEYVLPMLVGGVASFLWNKKDAAQEDAYNTPFASGLIVGEALLALVIPVLLFVWPNLFGARH